MDHHDTDRFSQNKRRVVEGLRRAMACAVGETRSVLADIAAPDIRVHAAHPINELSGRDAVEGALYKPLKDSFPDIQRADTIVMAGESSGADMVACMGHYVGTFDRDWLGIPATYKVTKICYGEAHRIEEGMIVESWVLIDVLDVMRQAGVWLLPTSLGAEGLWLPPANGSGVSLDSTDPAVGAETMAFVRAMQNTLMDFDGKTLASMNQGPYWSPTFNWYGPCGIGTTRGLRNFQAHHQIPFLIAFPDRKGGQHFVRMGDGNFAVTGGWPSVTATHTGDGWLGMPASGKRVGMRVMDFYRIEGDKIVENWIPLDILDLLKQMGHDVFERMAHLRGNPRLSLPWEE